MLLIVFLVGQRFATFSLAGLFRPPPSSHSWVRTSPRPALPLSWVSPSPRTNPPRPIFRYLSPAQPDLRVVRGNRSVFYILCLLLSLEERRKSHKCVFWKVGQRLREILVRPVKWKHGGERGLTCIFARLARPDISSAAPFLAAPDTKI
jgi:hypothetical protein